MWNVCPLELCQNRILSRICTLTIELQSIELSMTTHGVRR